MRKIQILRETRKRLRSGNFAGICIAIRDVLVDNEIDHNIRTVFPLLLETSAEKYRKPKDYLYDEYWWKPYEFGLFSGRRQFFRWLMRQYRNDKTEI